MVNLLNWFSNLKGLIVEDFAVIELLTLNAMPFSLAVLVLVLVMQREIDDE